MPEEFTELEQQLREAAAALDPPAPHLIDRAEAAFSWRTIDSELAELAYDSLAQERQLVRGGDQPRVLTFRTETLSIELELTGDRLVGALVPAQQTEVTLQHSDGREVSFHADQHGRFTAATRGGPLRLRCHPAGARQAVVTDWFSMGPPRVTRR
jgi:hypothetical protein